MTARNLLIANVDLDAQRFAVEVVVDVERAEATSRPQRIRHEVGGLGAFCPMILPLFHGIQRDL